MRGRVFSYIVGLCLLTQVVLANGRIENDVWIRLEQQRAIWFMLRNVSTPGTAAGSVIASPSQQNPNYYYHWIRDGALTMDTIVSLYAETKSSDYKLQLSQHLQNYIHFSQMNQNTQNRSGGLGEPKFNVDGTAFEGDWGRPQNDGPALRAITLIHYALKLMDEGQTDFVRGVLYDGSYPSDSIIKKDLEFVSNRWKEHSYDLWEEVNGDHFYTRMVQRKSLIEGAKLADRLGDPEAATWYRSQAAEIGRALMTHWSPQAGLIIPTLNRVIGPKNKKSPYDVAVILAALHGDTGDGFFGPLDDRILSTAYQIKREFQKAYSINQNPSIPGIAIGRYPDDSYDGTNTPGHGNPWFLATNAYAELSYRVRAQLQARGSLNLSSYSLAFFQELLPEANLVPGQMLQASDPLFQMLLDRLTLQGDSFLFRTGYHEQQQTGSMAEQFNRDSGFMCSARDLTWSYASFITAARSR